MAKRGRPAYADPPIEFKVYIPASLAARVKLDCYNPLRQNIKYGAQSGIMITALQEYFNRKDKGNDSDRTSMERLTMESNSSQANEASSPPSLSSSGPEMEPDASV